MKRELKRFLRAARKRKPDWKLGRAAWALAAEVTGEAGDRAEALRGILMTGAREVYGDPASVSNISSEPEGAGGPFWMSDAELDVPVTVCVAHLRFVPCRKGRAGDECVFSTEEEDMERVRAFQAGEMPAPAPAPAPADKRDVCGCHRDCSTERHVCAVPCRWPDCLTEEEAEELARTCSEGEGRVPVAPGSSGSDGADRGPLPASRFQVTGWNRRAGEFSEPADIRCLLCGVCSAGFGDGAALLSDLTDWAEVHRCPGLRVT